MAKFLKRFAFFDIKSIGQVQRSIDDLKKLAGINKKARKDIFFRNKLFKKPRQFGGGSIKSDIDDTLAKQADKVKHNMGLSALNEVLGMKKVHTKKLNDLGGAGSEEIKGFVERFGLKQKLKEIEDQKDIVKKGFRKFSKTPPEKKSHNILKRGLSKYQVSNAVEGSGEASFIQGNKMVFQRESVGKNLKDLKKTRKQMAMEVLNKKKKSSKQLHKDISNRGKTKVRFIRRNGRIIPIKVK